jgi:hypothetical protein
MLRDCVRVSYARSGASPTRRTGTPQGRTEIAQVGDGRAARLALDLNVVGIVVVKNDQRASAES